MKSDDFGPRPVEEPEAVEKSEEAKEDAPAPDAQAEPEPEDIAKGDPAPQESEPEPSPQLDEAAVIAKAEDVAKGVAEAIAKAQAEAIAEAVKPLQEQLAALGSVVEKMQKAPATRVDSHEDSGIPADVKKSQEGNVFRGVFGNLGR